MQIKIGGVFGFSLIRTSTINKIKADSAVQLRLWESRHHILNRRMILCVQTRDSMYGRNSNLYQYWDNLVNEYKVVIERHLAQNPTNVWVGA